MAVRSTIGKAELKELGLALRTSNTAFGFSLFFLAVALVFAFAFGTPSTGPPIGIESSTVRAILINSNDTYMDTLEARPRLEASPPAHSAQAEPAPAQPEPEPSEPEWP